MPKIEPQLKEAILNMPQKEKDKLLLRLVAKDIMLIARFQYQLIEQGESLEERISELLEQFEHNLTLGETFNYSPNYLMMAMRHCSGDISRHYKITKDKVSEITLTLAMINYAFSLNPSVFSNETKRLQRSEKFSKYVVKRMFTIISKAEKLHEDYYMEFRDGINKALYYIYQYKPSAIYAETEMLPKVWEG